MTRRGHRRIARRQRSQRRQFDGRLAIDALTDRSGDDLSGSSKAELTKPDDGRPNPA